MALKPYILGPVVAKGGMAEVYRGLQIGQNDFRRLVGVKRILPQFAQNAEFTTMFKDEARIGQHLQHPNIVRVECFDTIDGAACIIMEFVDGLDFRSLLSSFEQKNDGNLASGGLSPMLCAYVIAEAARGLHYAHTCEDVVSKKALNIIHRDISPQNILISWDGEVKVTDFGIAAADRDFKQTETKVGIVKGKFAYMSPEQIRGKKCDPRTDIFALCIVFWEALAMKRLFSADNEMDVIEMVRDCKITERLSKLNPNVSPQLEQIVLKGLDKDPDKRYSSMQELDKVLRVFISTSKTTTTNSDLSEVLEQLLGPRKQKSKEDTRQLFSETITGDPRGGAFKGKSIELTLDPRVPDFSALTIAQKKIPNSTSSNTSAHIAVANSRYAQARQQVQTSTIRGRPNAPTAASTNWLTWLVAMTVLFFGGSLLLKRYKQNAKKSVSSQRSSPAESPRPKARPIEPPAPQKSEKDYK
jgi:serine/threonine protein kinase